MGGRGCGVCCVLCVVGQARRAGRCDDRGHVQQDRLCHVPRCHRRLRALLDDPSRSSTHTDTRQGGTASHCVALRHTPGKARGAGDSAGSQSKTQARSRGEAAKCLRAQRRNMRHGDTPLHHSLCDRLQSVAALDCPLPCGLLAAEGVGLVLPRLGGGEGLGVEAG